MVEVDFDALGRRQAAQVFVVCIVLKEGYPVRTDALEDVWATVVLPDPEPPAMPITSGVERSGIME